MDLETTDGTERMGELRAFLLGRLSETEVERIEYLLLSDDGLYELLLATEEELIDEYLRGTLSDADVSSFLGYLDRLPGARKRIDFARKLGENLHASQTAAAAWRNRWRQAARGFSQILLGMNPAWAGAIVVAGLGVAIYTSIAAREPALLVLSAGLTRSEGDIPALSLSASGRRLEVMLELGVRSHDRYRATLRDAESRAIFSSEGLRAMATERQLLVPFSIPAEGLEPGDYSVSLEGEVGPTAHEPVRKYLFRLLE